MRPQVETTLCVTGGRLDFEAIGDALGLGPTSTCRAGELPAAVARAARRQAGAHGGPAWLPEDPAGLIRRMPWGDHRS